MKGVQRITTQLFAAVAAEAEASPRRRMNFNFHATAADNPHRMLNVLLRGTYVRPHRHVEPPKSEAFLALTGRVGVVCFDDDGNVAERFVMDAAAEIRGVDLEPGIWHTIVALSETSVCYEVKPGPWEPASDKDFAGWAPAEGTPGADVFVKRMEALFL